MLPIVSDVSQFIDVVIAVAPEVKTKNGFIDEVISLRNGLTMNIRYVTHL
jgi:hypothetical protein